MSKAYSCTVRCIPSTLAQQLATPIQRPRRPQSRHREPIKRSLPNALAWCAEVKKQALGQLHKRTPAAAILESSLVSIVNHKDQKVVATLIGLQTISSFVGESLSTTVALACCHTAGPLQAKPTCKAFIYMYKLDELGYKQTRRHLGDKD